MDNNNNNNNNDESICDGCAPLVYSDKYNLLPSTTLVDYMHIIKYLDINKETILKSLYLADGITTILYN